MRTSRLPKWPSQRTHEGAPAARINPYQELRRSVLSCLMWENTFYESGTHIALRIKNLIPKVTPQQASDLAIEARTKYKLRHVPLWIVRNMANLSNHKKLVAKTLEQVIQRPDEMVEFLNMYWLEVTEVNGKVEFITKRQPVSAQVKKGLAAAFPKFNAYQLAKYDRPGPIKLRDVRFIAHPLPKDAIQAVEWQQLIDGKLPIPETWETMLSAGMDKKETFEKLLRENKLGALALIRNLRNMSQAGVSEHLIFNALDNCNVEKIFPYRFITAAKIIPQWESHLENAMIRCLGDLEKMPGKTVLLVDISGSMDCALSGGKSTTQAFTGKLVPPSRDTETTRMDAACGLAILARELCERVSIYSFSNHLVRVPDRHGFALRDAVVNSQPHSGTQMGMAISQITEPYDRIIVFTDEQSSDRVPNPSDRGYIINVASYEFGVNYSNWVHINGWSEASLDYVKEYEYAEETLG